MQSFDEIKKKSLAFSPEAQKTIAYLADEFGRGESRIVANISLRSDGRLCIWVRVPHPTSCFNGVEVLNIPTTETSVKKYHDQLFRELTEITSGCNFKIIDDCDDADTGSYILIDRQ